MAEQQDRQLALDFSPRPVNDLARGKKLLREKLLQAYLTGLTASSWRSRRKAVRGLADLGGPEARDSAGRLEALLRDTDPRVRRAAAEALDRIRGPGHRR